LGIKTWVDEFTDIVSEYTDASLLAIRGAGYWIISATLGTFFIIRETQRDLPPNIYLVIAGPAGLTRKSTIINYAKTVYVSAWDTFYSNIGKDIDIQDKFIMEFTVEGICDNIEPLLDKIRDFVLISDEFGAWITRTRQKYLLGEKGLLASLYYGEGYKQQLSKRGGNKGERKLPPGLHVTMIAAMQNPDSYLTDVDVKQGFIRRLLLINVTLDDKRGFKPPLSHDLIYVKDELIDLGRKIGDKMTHIYEQFIKNIGDNYKINIFFSDEIIDLINEEAERDEKLAIEKYKDNDGVTGFLTTSWEYLMKLTVLEGLSDPTLYPRLLAGEPIMNIGNKEYFNKAYKFYKEYKKRMISMIIDVSVNKVKEEFKVASNIYEKILEKIREIESEYGYVYMSELQNRLHMSKQYLKRYIIDLLEQEKIYVVRVKIPGKSRGAKWGLVVFTNEDLMKDFVMRYPNHMILNSKQLEDIW